MTTHIQSVLISRITSLIIFTFITPTLTFPLQTSTHLFHHRLLEPSPSNASPSRPTSRTLCTFKRHSAIGFSFIFVLFLISSFILMSRGYLSRPLVSFSTQVKFMHFAISLPVLTFHTHSLTFTSVSSIS